MKTRLLVLLLVAGSSLLAGTHISIGVGIGAPYAYGYYAPPPPLPPPPVAYAPVAPAPGYVWVPGYYYLSGGRYFWRAGVWSRPPYRGAYWVAPRYHGHRYYSGHWRRR